MPVTNMDTDALQ